MAKFDIIAATGCPTGIAHTFMAKEALEKAAAERGLTIKVETHGQVGVENELTKSEIAGAKAVVVAADKDVQAERFAGKPMVSVGVSKALSVEAAGKLIDRALAAKGDSTVAAAADVEDEVEEKESIGHVIYKHLMNGVSHMLVFVVAGGVLTAVSMKEINNFFILFVNLMIFTNNYRTLWFRCFPPTSPNPSASARRSSPALLPV